MVADNDKTKQKLYKNLSSYYDKIYSKKDYSGESMFIKKMIKKHCTSEGFELLDLGCGTGNHMQHLKDDFKVTGFDLNKGMLDIARKRYTDVELIEGDMRSFDLRKKFDAIIWMFTLVNYNSNKEELTDCIKNISSHLKKGGVLIFDVGLSEVSKVRHGKLFFETYEDEHEQVVRFSQWLSDPIEKDKFHAKFIFMMKSEGKPVDFELDHHELGLFTTPYLKKVLLEHGIKPMIYADYKDTFFDGKSEKEQKPVFVCTKL